MRHKRKIGGEQTSFFMPDGGGYIWRESPGRPGVLGQQIDIRGNCLEARTAEGLKREVDRWVRHQRRGGR